MIGETALVRALVEFGILEGQREAAQRRVGVVSDERGDHRGVESTAQIGTDGNIGAQLQANAVDQQFLEFGGAVRLRWGRVIGRGERPVPVASNPNAGRLHRHRVTGRKRLDTVEDRSLADGAPYAEYL